MPTAMVGPIWAKRYFGGPIQGPKIHLKPPKWIFWGQIWMMVFLHRDNGEVLLWQYTWVSSTSSLPVEDIEHVLTLGVRTSETRKAKLPALLSFARQLDLAASNVHGNLQHAIFNLSWQLPGTAMQLATCNLQRANLSFEQDWSCSVRLAGNLLAAAAGGEDSDWYRLEQGTKKHCCFHL